MHPQRAFVPGRLGPLELRNRTIRAGAFEGMCPDARPSESLIRYHQAVAAGGIGMTTVAYVSVTRDGVTFRHQAWMRPEIVPDLRRLTDAVHHEGAAASIQIGHAGYMSDRFVTGRTPLAPSRVFNLFGLAMPRAMSETDIDETARAFGEATGLAREAGFDAVEVQACHGYLLSQFLSPYTNRRTDRFGGSLENRFRFTGLVLDRVREAAGGRLAVVVKTNVQDGFPRGMGVEEAVDVARMLEAAGADLLVLSGGFVSKVPMYVMRGETPLKDLLRRQPDLLRTVGLALFGKVLVRDFPFTEAYFLEDARRIRKAVRMPLALVGGIRSVDTMEKVLGEGFEFVAMARALIREPDFVLRVQRGEVRESRCEPCNKCMATMYTGEAVCLPEVERLNVLRPGA